MALQIGFSNQYYTLWNVSQTELHNGYFYYTIFHFNYIQNLSKDMDKAIEKASQMGCTDLIVNEELRGRNNSWEKKEIDKTKLELTENDILMSILCSNNKENLVEGVRPQALKVLVNRGYLTNINGIYTISSQVENMKRFFEDRENFLKIEVPTIFSIEKTPDSMGELIKSINNIHYCLRFKVKSQYYNGITSYLICDKTGKGKRTKGKSIELVDFKIESKECDSYPFGTWGDDDYRIYDKDEDFTFYGNITIEVNDIKVVK